MSLISSSLHKGFLVDVYSQPATDPSNPYYAFVHVGVDDEQGPELAIASVRCKSFEEAKEHSKLIIDTVITSCVMMLSVAQVSLNSQARDSSN